MNALQIARSSHRGSGIMPILMASAHYVSSRDVRRLTGLTGDQFREWTGRRRIISPDYPAKGRGNSARFSWRTVLLLRLLRAMQNEFRMELQPHQGAIRMME